MATIRLTAVTLVPEGFPCGSPGVVAQETLILNPTLRRDGYFFTGKISFNRTRYGIRISLTIAGDQMSGTMVTTRSSDAKSITNVLPPVTCAFPGIPHAASWDRVRFPGMNDYAAISLDSGALGLPAGARTKSVILRTGLIVLNTASNKTVSNVSRQLNLAGNDFTGWKLPGNIYKFTASIVNDIETQTFGQVISINLDYDDVLVQLANAAVRFSGSFKSDYTIDGKSSDSRTTTFASDFTSATYNKTFPWFNAFTILDSTNMDISLVESASFLPPLPAVYKVSILGYLTGSGA